MTNFDHFTLGTRACITVQGWGGGFQMLLLLSIGFTPLVKGCLDVPRQITLPRQTEEWYSHAERAWLPWMFTGSRIWCPSGCGRADVSGTVLLHPAGLGTETAGDAGTEERSALPPLALATRTEAQGGEGVCHRRPASCHLICQPSSPSLRFPASSRREPARPSWKGNSVAETEWVQWFKWSELDSCQWKGN